MLFALATIEHAGQTLACLEIDQRFYPLESAVPQLGLPSTLMAVFEDWDHHHPSLVRYAALCQPDGGLAREQVQVLAPLLFPGKVLCAGANYYDHLAEMGVTDLTKAAQRLFFFFKPARSAVVGHEATVNVPLGCQMFDWEVELALVIGKESRRLTLDNAMDAVAAYSVAIDLSARDFNQAPQTFYKLDWVAGKGQDMCCPLGPRLIPASQIANAGDLALQLSVNGESKQNARTSGMVFDIKEQLVTLSNIMTLYPGDVVLTGTPAGVGFPKRTFLKPGDRIEAHIESIGTLSVTIGEPQ
jgi:2-keto-4-pentenoate hydratase/2-oxohepta-3-ene-1,7-dioic acid hydratase in catechol pathway